MNIYDFEAHKIDGQTQSLRAFEGHVLLVVNTASACGFTPQYKGLEQLYQTYRARGFAVLGFPCNQFGEQERGSNREIQQFCEVNFKISFPLFGKIDVKGPNAHPLYRFLVAEKPGLLGWMGLRDVKWNFTKFLVDRQGRVVKRYAPTVAPEAIGADIETYLAAADTKKPQT